MERPAGQQLSDDPRGFNCRLNKPTCTPLNQKETDVGPPEGHYKRPAEPRAVWLPGKQVHR